MNDLRGSQKLGLGLARLQADEQQEVVRSLESAASSKRDYILLILPSCIIASLGLLLNSAAVIIGAMLISPLMSPILSFSLSLLRRDWVRLRGAFFTLLLGLVLAIALSSLITQLLLAAQWSLADELPAEILSRTRPTLLDLIVALAGGGAAAYALCRPHLSAAIPGVAIATALMPPLCVVGIGVSAARTDLSSGAMLLFVANLVAIIFASALVFAALGFGGIARARRGGLLPGLLLSFLMVLAVAVPLAFVLVQIINDANESLVIRNTLTQELSAISADAGLVHFDRSWRDDRLDIDATVRSPKALSLEDIKPMQSALADDLQKTVALRVFVIPMTRLDPLAPPTRTSTTSTSRTSTPAAVITVTPLPSPTATAFPPVTPTPSPMPRGANYGVVGATDGLGVYVHRAPELDGIFAALPDQTLVLLTDTQATADGYQWAQVVLADGRVGWIVADYLIPWTKFPVPEH